MAAVLLATSCSKDDGNDAAIDTPIDNPQQTVYNAYKTVTISGKVGKATLSKVTVAEKQLTFEGDGTEKLTFGVEGDDVYGDITIKDAYGQFEATLHSSSDEALLSTDGFTATLGSKPAGLSTGYGDLATAVKNAYYVIPFKVVEDGAEEGKYKLTENTLSKDEPSYDVKVYVQAAFIKAQGTRTIKLNDEDIKVEINNFYVVPVGAQMGSDAANKTVAGKVYTVNKIAGGISYANRYVGKFVGGDAFTNEITVKGKGTVSYKSDNETVASVDEVGKVTINGAGKATITATFEAGEDETNETAYADKDKTATYTLVVAPDADCIPGLFSVSSDGKPVFFSKGNLQATATVEGGNCSWSWGFATNQYDYIGNAAANTKINGNGTVSANGVVDLFGWVGNSNTTWTGAAQHGISNSGIFNDASTYGNNRGDVLASDWGSVIGDGNIWSTLSTAQWRYLFNTRENHDKLYGHGVVGGKNGMIILPDGWEAPAGISFTSGNSEWANSYDAEQWKAIESAGAVFLPAAGLRDVSSVDGAGSCGSYWSSSALSEYRAYSLCFGSGYLDPSDDYGYRFYGFSVRLVRSL